MKLYVDHCEKLSEAPNAKLLMKLYYLEVNLNFIRSQFVGPGRGIIGS